MLPVSPFAAGSQYIKSVLLADFKLLVSQLGKSEAPLPQPTKTARISIGEPTIATSAVTSEGEPLGINAPHCFSPTTVGVTGDGVGVVTTGVVGMAGVVGVAGAVGVVGTVGMIGVTGIAGVTGVVGVIGGVGVVVTGFIVAGVDEIGDVGVDGFLILCLLYFDLLQANSIAALCDDSETPVMMGKQSIVAPASSIHVGSSTSITISIGNSFNCNSPCSPSAFVIGCLIIDMAPMAMHKTTKPDNDNKILFFTQSL